MSDEPRGRHRDRGRRVLPPAGPGVDQREPRPGRARAARSGMLAAASSEEDELAAVAHDRELQRTLFDAGFAGHLRAA